MRIIHKFYYFVSKFIPFDVQRSVIYKIRSLFKKNYQFSRPRPYKRDSGKDGFDFVNVIEKKSSISINYAQEGLAASIKEAGFEYGYLNNNAEPSFNINIYYSCGTAGFFKDIVDMDQHIFQDRYNILFYITEFMNLPPWMQKVFDFFDEVWVPSEFVGTAVKRVSSRPVITVPHVLMDMKIDKDYRRKSLCIDEDCFVVLMMYDSKSDEFDRKNSQGMIEAYIKAFLNEEKDVKLIIKTTMKSDAIMQSIVGRSDIIVIDEILSHPQINALIALSDVYLSLYRAEGFGLIVAEAMSLGTPVIATGYSGPMDFIDENTACIVNYKLRRIGKESIHLSKRCLWADADTDEAAQYLRQLKDDPDMRERLAVAAKKHIDEFVGIKRISEIIKKRVDAINSMQPRKENNVV